MVLLVPVSTATTTFQAIDSSGW